MSDQTLKVTVEYGKEEEFMEYCKTSDIAYRQYPAPITWAFRVTLPNTKSHMKDKISELPYVKKVESMPMVSVSGPGDNMQRLLMGKPEVVCL